MFGAGLESGSEVRGMNGAKEFTMKHTEGPWHVWNKQYPRVGPTHNCTVAGVFACPVGDQQANAQLLAAAPEMLEALLDAVRLIEHLGGNAEFHKRAIANATGDAMSLPLVKKTEMNSRELEFLEIVTRQRDTMDKLIKRVERLESKSVMTEVIGFQ